MLATSPNQVGPLGDISLLVHYFFRFVMQTCQNIAKKAAFHLLPECRRWAISRDNRMYMKR